MIIRNGIKSTFRAKGRTALFMLLIFILTVTMTLGLGLWAYCGSMLEHADRTYTSVVLAEYIGAEYNDDDAADDHARAAAQEVEALDIGAMDGVELWERSGKSLGNVEGYKKLHPDTLYKDDTILYVSRFIPMENEVYGSFSDSSLLPQDCVVFDFEREMCIFYESGQIVDEVSLVHYDTEYGYYTFQGDTPERTLLTEDTLPDPCVVYGVDEMSVFQCQYISREESVNRSLGDSNLIFYSNGQYHGLHEEISYSVRVEKAVYAASDVEDKLINLDTDDIEFKPQKGETYLVHAVRVDTPASGIATYMVTAFEDDVDVSPYLQVSDDRIKAENPTAQEQIFYDHAEKYRIINNYVRMETSCDIASLEVFHQGVLHLEEGRFPKAGETGVCVINGAMAMSMNLSAGDTVCVSELVSDSADRMTFQAEKKDERTLTIVGITNADGDYGDFIWASADVGDFSSEMFGYQLGRAVVDNKKGSEIAAMLQEMVPAQVRVTLFDQGYAEAARPLEMMLSTARAVTAAAFCATLVVLILFAYLFVGKQKETVQMLAALGTKSGEIRLWILSGVGLLLLISVLSGTLAGTISFQTITKAALSAAKGMYLSDQRYSEALVGVHIALDEIEYAPLWPALAAGVGIFCAAMLLCIVFLYQIQRRSVPERGKSVIRVPKGGTSTAGQGALRFAFLSACRGGWRSWVVLLVSLGLSVFAGILLGNSRQREQTLEELYESRIEGMAVTTNGRAYSGLSVSAVYIREIVDFGLIDEVYFGKGWHYWMPEEMPDFGKSEASPSRRKVWISKQPEVVALNDLKASAEFYYVNEPEIEWMAGWDASMFLDETYSSIFSQFVIIEDDGKVSTDSPVYPALCSRSFTEKYGLEPGDEFFVNLQVEFEKNEFEMSVDLKVVGEFTPQGNKDYIYVPLAAACPLQAVLGDNLAETEESEKESRMKLRWTKEEFDSYLAKIINFETVRFRLDSARNLQAFRDYLGEHNYSGVNNLRRNRTTIMLRDENFTETVNGIQRYLTFTGLLFPALLLVSGLLGFVVSWLMMNNRRMEFAIMRSMGAAKIRVFLSFFLEQGCLCLAGCLCGMVFLLLFAQGWIACLAALGFLICYLAGCVVSVLVIGKVNLMTLLAERE